jgi:8-oxo-dGTP diphosphatase
MDITRPIVGVAAHVCRNGKVLAFERIGALGTHTWSVLGGHLEHGETPEAGAMREALEEGGVTTHSPQIFAVTSDVFPDSGRHYVTIHVALKTDSDHFTNAEPDKHANLNWYAWHAMPTPRFPCIQSVYDQNLQPPYLEG